MACPQLFTLLLYPNDPSAILHPSAGSEVSALPVLIDEWISGAVSPVKYDLTLRVIYR